jgi:FixJ family two-component response regulator
MSGAPRVFLVDDQPAVLKALARLLAAAGIETACFESAQAFLDSGNAVAPGCLLLDLSMPGMDGIELQRALGRMACTLPVIFLSGTGDIDSSVRAMKFGAADFLTKPVDGDKLLAAVRSAFAADARLRAERALRDGLRARLASLTPRESEVLHLIAQGKLNKQAAAELGTAEKTIKVHRARIMTKLNVRSLAELVRLVDRAGASPP